MYEYKIRCKSFQVCAPKEKKSTAGAAGVGRAFGNVGRSSVLTFALPRASDGGRNGTAADLEEAACGIGVASSNILPERGARFVCAFSSCSSSTSSTVACFGGRFTPVLKTKPGPLPPPKTRSGIGSLFFGAGSIENNDDEPAPISIRGFFAGGISSMSSLRSLSFESSGNPMAIFFGAFFFGTGSDRLEDVLDPEAGGGSERPVFFCAAAGLAVNGV